MTVTIKDRHNIIPQLVEESEALDGTTITAGVHGDDDSNRAMVALVHEFGAEIEVTDAMRGWFAWQGFPLSPDTEVIVIPQRSFLRPAMDNNESEMGRLVDALLQQLMAGEVSGGQMKATVGTTMVSKIRETLDAVTSPPLSGMTKQRKGSAEPLQDTGGMRQLIAFQVND